METNATNSTADALSEKSDLFALIELERNNCGRLLALLHRHPVAGVQYRICQYLEGLNLSEVLPQLIQTMLAGTQPSLSIYALLVRKARRSVSFQTELFLILKGILGKAEEAKASFCYFLCCDLFNIARARSSRNLSTLALNYRAAETARVGRRAQFDEHLDRMDNSEAAEQKGELENKDGLINSSVSAKLEELEINEKADEQTDEGRSEVELEVQQDSIDPPPTDENLSKAKTFLLKHNEKTEQNNENLIISNEMPLSKEEPTKNKRVMPRKRISFRTQAYQHNKSRMPIFNSLVFSFVRAVSALIDDSLFKGLNGILRTFSTKKNFKNLQMNQQTTSLFKRNVIFYEMLVTISNRLRLQPVALRQRSLEAELAFLSLTLTGPMLNPFDPRTSIVSFVVEECVILDSAEHVPYLAIAEVVDTHCPPPPKYFSARFSAQAQKAAILQSHLSSVNELNDVGDINGIKENILDALELVLFNDGRRGASGAVSTALVVQNSSLPPNNESEGSALVSTDKGPKKDKAGKGSKHKKTAELKPKCWETLREEIRRTSPLSGCPGWSLLSLIVKSGSTLRLEHLAYQILTAMRHIFTEEAVPCFIRDYKIYIVSETSGLIETVTDAYSIHKIKSTYVSLLEYFKATYPDLETAKTNFRNSLAGYSLASFILQLKDRHNGNILIDAAGHTIHVDFGFILGDHPGFYCVENAPFKFSAEYLDLVTLADFRLLFHQGFCALRKHHSRITRLVEIMENAGYCVAGTAAALSLRFNPTANDREFEDYCTGLVDRSVNNMRTVVYDRFQYFSNGYY